MSKILLLVVIVVVVVVVVLLVTQGIIKLPSTTRSSDVPEVELKTEYKNPFDENAQYTNPFSDYKNPFDGLE